MICYLYWLSESVQPIVKTSNPINTFQIMDNFNFFSAESGLAAPAPVVNFLKGQINGADSYSVQTPDGIRHGFSKSGLSKVSNINLRSLRRMLSTPGQTDNWDESESIYINGFNDLDTLGNSASDSTEIEYQINGTNCGQPQFVIKSEYALLFLRQEAEKDNHAAALFLLRLRDPKTLEEAASVWQSDKDLLDQMIASSTGSSWQQEESQIFADIDSVTDELESTRTRKIRIAGPIEIRPGLIISELIVDHAGSIGDLEIKLFKEGIDINDSKGITFGDFNPEISA